MAASPATFLSNIGCNETMTYQDDRIRKLIEELPTDRPITIAEAERILVEMYRIERNSERIAARMGCSGQYVLTVVRRHEPDLIWRGRRRGTPAPLPEQVYDLREARKFWRAEGYRNQAGRAGCADGEGLPRGRGRSRDIARRECIGRDAVAKAHFRGCAGWLKALRQACHQPPKNLFPAVAA